MVLPVENADLTWMILEVVIRSRIEQNRRG